MSVGDNFDPDLQYFVIWNGGELLPPRPEKTSASWATNEERRGYTQTGNYRRVYSGASQNVIPPSIAEDPINLDPEGESVNDVINLQDLLDIEEMLKHGRDK